MTKQRIDDKAVRRDRPVEITPQMIEAGADILELEFDRPDRMKCEGVVEEIIFTALSQNPPPR